MHAIRQVWWTLIFTGAGFGAAGCASEDDRAGRSDAGGADASQDATAEIRSDAIRPDAPDAGPESGLAVDADAAADGGTSGDATARSDLGADAASACPLNSGWPCPCSGVNECENGDICFGIGPGEGLCAPRCAGAGDDAPCAETMGWGISGGGRCAYEVTYEGQTFGVCALICQVQAEDGEVIRGFCPPGSLCVPQNGFSACFAGP